MMGVRYGRDYEDIIEDLMEAVNKIDDFYHFINIDQDFWSSLNKNKQKDCLQTLTDDIFYALESNHDLQVGSGSVVYDCHNNIIKVHDTSNCTHIINLV